MMPHYWASCSKHLKEHNTFISKDEEVPKKVPNIRWREKKHRRSVTGYWMDRKVVSQAGGCGRCQGVCPWPCNRHCSMCGDRLIANQWSRMELEGSEPAQQRSSNRREALRGKKSEDIQGWHHPPPIQALQRGWYPQSLCSTGAPSPQWVVHRQSTTVCYRSPDKGLDWIQVERCGGTAFLQYVRNHSTNGTVTYPRRVKSYYSSTCRLSLLTAANTGPEKAQFSPAHRTHKDNYGTQCYQCKPRGYKCLRMWCCVHYVSHSKELLSSATLLCSTLTFTLPQCIFKF
jgi:hypothetical protein